MAPFTFKDVRGTEDLKERLKEGVFESDYTKFVRSCLHFHPQYDLDKVTSDFVHAEDRYS